MTSDKATSLELRLNALLAGDTWHTLSLNSWSGSLKYRYGFDLRSVFLKFNISNPGGHVGDGTGFLIATLPSGYRPNNRSDFALTCDVTGSSGQSPHVSIGTDGTMNVFGIGSGAASVSLSADMPIFDD